jgi:predicted transposase YbfD/YdcC
MVVKKNHKTLFAKLARFFAGSCLFAAEFTRASTCEDARGRVETRVLVASSDLPRHYTGFAGVQQLFCLTRTILIKKSGEVREETVYGMTSLSVQQASPKRLLSVVRGHWHIENKSHYVRDVTYGEDHSQVRKGNIPQVMAALRNTCIGLMRTNGHTNIAQACRTYAAQPEAALELMGIRKTE